jgi:DNA-binding response OmpR family regulator
MQTEKHRQSGCFIMNIFVKKPRLSSYRKIENPLDRFPSWQTFNQIDKERARALFDYRDGKLYWRNMVGRRRPEAGSELMRKTTGGDPVWVISLGSRQEVRRYMRCYLVWNWHYGKTDRILRPLDGDHLNDRIGNIGFAGPLPQEEMPAPAPQPLESKYGVNCPCCGSGVQVMTADLATQVYGITEQQARILRAIWSGKGKPVHMERVFSEMYADDPDGGPTQEKMYLAFKVAMSHLRTKLEGSGISVETVGYRQGYRLILGDRATSPDSPA